MTIQKQAVFTVIYTEYPIYLNDNSISSTKRNTVIPLVLFSNRWDGRIGLLGGLIDEGENIKDTAFREIVEEAGFTPEKDNLQYVSTHENAEIKTHLFCLQVNFETFKNIIRNQVQADHFLTEVSLFGVHFINYEHRLSFDNFMKNHFPATVKSQIKDLVLFLQWDKKYKLPIK